MDEKVLKCFDFITDILDEYVDLKKKVKKPQTISAARIAPALMRRACHVGIAPRFTMWKSGS